MAERKNHSRCLHLRWPPYTRRSSATRRQGDARGLFRYGRFTHCRAPTRPALYRGQRLQHGACLGGPRRQAQAWNRGPPRLASLRPRPPFPLPVCPVPRDAAGLPRSRAGDAEAAHPHLPCPEQELRRSVPHPRSAKAVLLTFQLLPNRPNLSCRFPSLFVTRLPSPVPHPARGRLARRPPQAAGGGNSFVSGWLKPLVGFSPNRPLPCPAKAARNGPPFTGRPSRPPRGGGRRGKSPICCYEKWPPFHGLSCPLTFQLLPNRPQSFGSQAQLPSRLKSSSLAPT
jgi:hypothetical protein